MFPQSVFVHTSESQVDSKLTIPNLLRTDPSNQQPKDFTFNILQPHFLSLSLNKLAFKSSCKERRIETEQVLGNFKCIGIFACAGVDLDVGLLAAVGS